MRDPATSAMPVERVIQIQALYFQAVENFTLTVASAFVAATLAIGCTIGGILVSRRATMRQINRNLTEIFEHFAESAI